MFHSAIVDIYPDELKLKKTTESSTTLSYLDIKVGIVNGKYSTEVYDKRDDFNFNIVNFSFLCSNIPSGPAYGVYISQLVRIGRICSNYSSFALRHRKLTERLVHQGFRYSSLCKAFDKFARRHGQILDKYSLGVRIMAFVCRWWIVSLVAMCHADRLNVLQLYILYFYMKSLYIYICILLSGYFFIFFKYFSLSIFLLLNKLAIALFLFLYWDYAHARVVCSNWSERL